MPPELFALLVAMAIGALAGMGFERFLSKRRRRAWRGSGRFRWSRPYQGARFAATPAPTSQNQDISKQPDAADQLRIVMAANFSLQSLLNKSEARVFRELDRNVKDRNPAWHVMAQVSLGEVLRSTHADAYGCINSKRVDLLLMDGDYQPRHAIEYQGGAHHQGSAAARDAVKKEALRRAGIGYHEVVAGQTTPADLRQLVEKLVDGPNGRY